MAKQIIIKPTVEPLTVEEVSLDARIDDAAENTRLTAFIKAARERAEFLTGRALISQTWQESFNKFLSDEIKLAINPVITITSIEYINTSGILTTLDPSNYQLVKSDGVCKIIPAYGKTWPVVREYSDAVKITYTAGYGDDATDVPFGIKQWMYMTIASWYKNRESLSETAMSELPHNSFDGLLDEYRTYFG